MKMIEQLIPFIVGLCTQLIGSAVQWSYIAKMRQSGEFEQALRAFRDGDTVQLICTMSAVVPSAVIVLHDRLLLLTITAVLGVALPVVAYFFLSLWDEADYFRHSKWIFSPACNVAVLLCIIGGFAAAIGAPN